MIEKVEIRMPEWHDKQKELLNLWNDNSFVVCVAGRRSGKTACSSFIALDYALKGKSALIMCPTYEQAYDIYAPNYLIPMATKIGLIYETEIQLARNTFQFDSPIHGEGKIFLRSATAHNKIRGQKYDFILLDEFADFPNAGEVWEKSLMPTLLDNPESKCIIIGTPKGQNYFYQLYQNSFSSEDWASLHFPTTENPYISKTKLEQHKKNLSENAWRQEYLAEFISDGLLFPDIEHVAVEYKNHPHAQFCFGIDIGKDRDHTAVAIFDKQEKHLVDIVRLELGLDYPSQIDELKKLKEKWKPTSIIIEKNNAGNSVIDFCRKEGLQITEFITTNESKRDIIEDLLLSIEKNTIRINNKMASYHLLKHEFAVFTETRTKTGLKTYGALPGYHDDMVMATAIGWRYARKISGLKPIVLKGN